ncbi:MAG TPA: cation:proton antiporter [Alphaproteobacteria bacterium]|nr:cation:proton antiporter [Alphaproteobacteria bacterium]
MNVISVLLGISVILFLGFFAEFLFKRFNLPDLLVLIATGFLIGPYVFNFVTPDQIIGFAPLFTTFTLLFLLYDGSFNISLESLAKGAIKSLQITMVNFTLSVIVVMIIMWAFGFDWMTALLVGFILGGACSAFTMPLLKQLKIEGETYPILALESALTDVFSIVFAFTVMQIMTINTLNFQVIFSSIASLFAVAGFIGILAGIVWIVLVMKIFKEHKSYMITIAYLILIYVLTEYLNGNGAIAALFFGLMLKNSKDITTLFSKLLYKGDDKKKQEELKQKYVIDVTNSEEEFFYSQISFFLKTFFFVYIGLLINFSDTRALIIGGIIALAIMATRQVNKYLTKRFSEFDQHVISGIYARGLASAAIAQVVVVKMIPRAQEIVSIVFAVILFTIVLSSANIYIVKSKQAKKAKAEKKAAAAA